MRSAPSTFDTRLDAEMWLSAQAQDLRDGSWTPPKAKATHRPKFGPFAEDFLGWRDLTPRTRAEYEALLDAFILPTWKDVRLDRITPTSVQNWYSTALPADKSTTRAHAYSLFRNILNRAYDQDLIKANPCRIEGGGTPRKLKKSRPASVAELQAITEAMPKRYQAMVILAGWCALRFGELTELRRQDLDMDEGVVRVTRAVTRVRGEFVVGDPKSEAGTRDVHIPSELLPAIQTHLDNHVDPELDALVFPALHGGHMAPSSLYGVFYRAREKAGRPDLRWHDLRHTGAVLAALSGATLADLQARLGHTTVQAAMIYQHSAENRDKVLAEAMADLIRGDSNGGNVPKSE